MPILDRGISWQVFLSVCLKIVSSPLFPLFVILVPSLVGVYNILESRVATIIHKLIKKLGCTYAMSNEVEVAKLKALEKRYRI